MQKRTYRKLTDEKLAEIAAQYETRGEFGKKDPSAYIVATKRGLLDSICAHMRNPKRKWALKTLQEEALKYTTRTEFCEGNHSAYCAAQRMGVLNAVCSHMPRYAGKGKKRGPNIRTLRKEYF